MIPFNITRDLISEIATHHDAHPTDYRDFPGPNGALLATKEGGRTDGSGLPSHRLKYRINDVMNIFDGRPIPIEFPLVIGDGSTYVSIFVKKFGR